MTLKNQPWYWIPFLNFASGLPYAIIISVSVLLYKNLGINNEDIGIYTSLLYLPWVIKPLWSPFIDLYATKKQWFVCMQLLIALTFILIGFVIPTSHFFVVSLALFWVAAFASASNDVASDGFYMLALEKEEQSFFLGIRSTFYRLALLSGNGLIVIIAGHLEKKFSNPSKAWSYTLIIVGVLMLFLAVYNYFFTPKSETEKSETINKKAHFGVIFTSFFQKKQMGLILSFILVFRLGESQLLKMLTPFLVDPTHKGGLQLSTEDVGVIYGTFGVFALVIGGILGGIAISKIGLGKTMLPLFLFMHLPILGFVFLSYFHPQALFSISLLSYSYALNPYITGVVVLEQFGYGFGFSAFMMYLIYVADGPHKTAHYALATGFMALGMMLPGMLSGYLQQYLGYSHFFIWVLLATIPGLILSRFLEFPSDYGKKGSAAT